MEGTLDLDCLLIKRADWRRAGATVVLASGCFDLIHRGHVEFLQRARTEGDVLVVGLYDDASVRSIKGVDHPAVLADDRAAVVGAFAVVDAVVIVDGAAPGPFIAALQPDVLVTGGDAPAEQVVAAALRVAGARTVSIPLLASPKAEATPPAPLAGLIDSIRVKQHLLADCGGAILTAGQLLARALLAGGKVLIFGNGGSAAEAQHMAAEFVGRFRGERRALPALALSTDAVTLTALGNDFGFEQVFVRQLEALARPGDVVIALSTSGTSPNILAGVRAARNIGCTVLGITGARGRALAGLCDAPVLVPSETTSRIQEASLTVTHLWCEIVETVLAGTPNR